MISVSNEIRECKTQPIEEKKGMPSIKIDTVFNMIKYLKALDYIHVLNEHTVPYLFELMVTHNHQVLYLRS